jgi:hypothetical protein
MMENCNGLQTGGMSNPTLQAFERLRAYVEESRQCGVGAARRVPVPPLKDRVAWHVFCVGSDDAHGNFGSYFQDDDDDEDDNNNDQSTPPTPEEIPIWNQQLLATGLHTPSVELLAQLDQVAARRVLSNLAYYVVRGWSAATPHRAAWIYALLARLDRHPLHRDELATLRSLLRPYRQNGSISRTRKTVGQNWRV